MRIALEARVPYLSAGRGAMEAGPSWLKLARHEALENFFRAGFPAKEQEDWKYTSLAALEKRPLHSPAPGAEFLPDNLPSGHLLSYGNGYALSRSTALPENMLGRMDRALEKADAALAKRFGALAGKETALVALNTALWREGAMLHVPRERQVQEPVFLIRSIAEDAAMVHERSLIVIEAGAQATVVELCNGRGEYWRNPVTEIFVGENARLLYVKLIEESAAATYTGTLFAQQGSNSRLDVLSLALTGRLTRQDIELELDGEGASTTLNGGFLAGGRAHVDHHTRIEHRVPNTQSREVFRGIAGGRGRGVFDGLIVVNPGAQKTDAKQSSRNLLLSPHAEIDAKPQLEIYADDVKCGHGATVGRLDEGQVFYLKSRGIGDAQARALLMRAFVLEACAAVPDGGLRNWLESRVEAALANLAGASQQ